MNYIPLSEHPKAWVFHHQELPINEADLHAIKLMNKPRAAVLWTTFISREKDHPDFFTEDDWQQHGFNWQADTLNWEGAWEEGEVFPPLFCEHLGWEDNTTVYFCNSREEVFETQFGVFKRHWQNFMFLADGSVLVGKKRVQAIQFSPEGQAKLGQRRI